MIDSDAVVEAMVQEKGLTAPRVMPKTIDAMVASLTFKTHRFEGTTTMVALALLPNGFSVGMGQSACASPENFNAEVGEKIAVDNARDAARQKLWELEGYVLKREMTLAQAAIDSAAAAQSSRPTQNCVFKYCPDEADCRANGCSMGAAPDSAVS